MKHKLLLTLPVALLLGCQAPEPKTTEPDNTATTMNTTNDQNAIKELLFAYRDALNASSTDQVIPLYTTDGVFMPTGFPTSIGTEQVRQAYDGVFANIKLSIEFFIDEVLVDGDHAFAHDLTRHHAHPRHGRHSAGGEPRTVRTSAHRWRLEDRAVHVQQNEVIAGVDPRTYRFTAYRSATAPDPNSSRPTSFRSTIFDSPENKVGP